jgi:hypothetical protein
MKKIILCFIFFGVTGNIFTVDNKIVVITLDASPLYGGDYIQFYNDSYWKVNGLMERITNSKRSFAIFANKAALVEGTYIIEVYDNDLLIQSFEVLNAEDVYDKTHHRYLKCQVLSDIHYILALSLLKKYHDPL